MSKARSLADLISGGAVIEASEIADSTITGAKLASDISFQTSGSIAFGDAAEKISGNGTELKIESSGKIILDSDTAGTIQIADNNTQLIKFFQFSNFVAMESMVSNKDLHLRGNDNGSYIDALSFDMSEAGAATFNDKVILGANKSIELGDPGETISGDGTDLTITSSRHIKLDATNDITLDAGAGGIKFDDDGATIGLLFNASGDLTFKVVQQDKDLNIKGNDGGVEITALTLDMSAAGAATFNDKVILGANKVIEFGDVGETISGDGTDLTITSSNDLDLVSNGTGTQSTLITSAGGIYLDSAETNRIDAATGTTNFYKSGTLGISLNIDGNNDTVLHNRHNDKDIKFDGQDNNSTITALTLDMSAAGKATFNDKVILGASKRLELGDPGEYIFGDGTNLTAASSGYINLSSTGNLLLNTSSTSSIFFRQNDVNHLQILKTGDNPIIKSSINDGDLIIKGNDGGVEITALTLDMSEGGIAKFNKSIALGSDTVANHASGSLTGVTKLVFGGDNDANGVVSGRIYSSGNALHIQGGTSGLNLRGANNNVHLDINCTTGNVGICNNLTIAGDLTVNGTTTTLNTATLDIEDKTLCIAKGAANAAAADGAGIIVDGASACLTFTNSTNSWDFNEHVIIQRPSNEATNLIVGNSTNNHEIAVCRSGSNPSFVKIQAHTNEPKIMFCTLATSGGLRFSDPSDNVLMKLTTSGNLGIGTSSPSSQLHIVGSDITDQVIIENSDDGGGSAPDLVFYRNSPSPAVNDFLGRIDFRGKNDNGASIDYGSIYTIIDDETLDTEDGSLWFQTRRNGTTVVPLKLKSGEVIINDNAIDTNFRVESTNNANMLFVDAGADRVGIGKSSPTSTVDIRGANGAVQSRGLLYLSNNDTYGINKGSQISFGGTYDSTNDTFFAAVAGRKENGTSGNYEGYLQFSTRQTSGNNERMRITSGGCVGIGHTNPVRNLSVFKSDYPTIQLVNSTSTTGSTDGAIIQLHNTDMDLVIRNQENADIRFDTNGANERMRIMADGKVGIGTASPTDELHLKTGDGFNPPTIRLEAGGGQFTCLIGMGNGTDTCLKSGYGLSLMSGTNSDIHFKVNNIERMAIQCTGHVGIGVSSPSSRLDVRTTLTSDTQSTPETVLKLSTLYNSTSAEGAAGSGTRIEFEIPDDETNPITGAAIAGLKESGDDSVANAALAFYVSQDDTTLDEAMRINSAGQVGIGTASPTQALTIAGGNNAKIGFTGGGVQSLYYYDTDSSLAGYFHYQHSVDQFRMNTSGSIALTGGNVGIGTTSPSNLLHIFSSAPKLIIQDGGTHGTNSAPRLEFKDGSSIQGFVDFADDGTMRIDQLKANPLTFLTNNVERMRISSAGLVGIGTSSPSRKLHIVGAAGTAQLQSTGTSSALYFADTNSSTIDNQGIHSSGDRMAISAGGLFRLSVREDGHVGIGETDPGYDLVVDGGANTTIRVQNDTPHYGDFQATTTGIQIRTIGSYPLIFNTNQTERMRISSDGQLLIGTTDAPSSADTKLKVHVPISSSSRDAIELSHNTTGTDKPGAAFGLVIQNGGSSTNAAQLTFKTANGGSLSERMRISNNGNVGIGTTSPASKLHILQTAETFDDGIKMVGSSGPISGRIYMSGEHLHIDNATAGAGTGFTLEDNGKIGIGTSNPTETFEVNGDVVFNGSAGNKGLALKPSAAGSTTILLNTFADNSSGRNWAIRNRYNAHGRFEIMRGTTNTDAPLTTAFRINNDSSAHFTGALSKASGSFQIDHPLESKKDTHNLVHSFVEAPQADNIYRGKVDLVGGTSTVNIDTNSGMSDGTFVLLNREIQVFTSNETGWTAVKGSVSGNTLTITAQDNTCTDTISWLVIGERQDQHMYNTNWTDENGKVIVEPLKETEETLEDE